MNFPQSSARRALGKQKRGGMTLEFNINPFYREIATTAA